MQFAGSHSIEEKIKSLSGRLKYYARDNNTYKSYIDQNIKSENLQLNLSLVLAHIIVNLTFIERSQNVFENIIEEYNGENNTTLTFKDFANLCWVRKISDEIRIPSIVQSFIWKVGHNEKEGKPVEFPHGKEDMVRCLQVYYKKCFENARLTISLEKLNDVIRTKGSPLLSINFFEQRKIVAYDPEKQSYYWQHNEYQRHLRKEIVSTLWLLVAGENASAAEFSKFFKLIYGAGLWVANLRDYLNYQNTTRISDLAISYLNAEHDLLQSEEEIKKIWLDRASYVYGDVSSDVPKVVFNYANPFDFIENVNYHQWRLHDTFDHQATRKFCHLLIQLIIHNAPRHTFPFQNVLKIFKDTSRPFLIWALYEEIQRCIPEVIPYLLMDTELVPIAFKLADKIEIDPTFLSVQSNNEKRITEGYQLKQRLWLEMFDITIENIALVRHYEDSYGVVLGEILAQAAEKIFISNDNNPNNIARHNTVLEGFKDTLKKLINKRITTGFTYPRPPINPRLIFVVLPGIVAYLIEKTLNRLPPHTEFLHLQSGLFDLSIEMLKMSNVRITETEIADDQKNKITKASTDLIELLQNVIVEFYTIEEIDVQTYYDKGIERRKVKRGVNDFGFEIIDWGYLFLHFEHRSLLKSVNERFISSLNFDPASDRYNEQNQEQSEKIRLYLKSMMIGVITINQKKDLYEIEGLPVKSTLEKLEEYIRDLALTYSIDKLSEKRIDAFDERFKTRHNLYYQKLTALLYKSVNYFSNSAKIKFIAEFFGESNDIGRMLTAINILDSKELSDIISKRIAAVPIEEFIKASSTTTELQLTLIEAINSDSHWQLAKPLIQRIQDHYEKVKHNNKNTEYLFFEVNLLLAYKEKDFNKLITVPMPKMENYYPQENQKAERLQRYFIALFNIYNEKKYKEGIFILKSLLSAEPKNIRYAFHLYRAETLNAIQSK